MFIQKYNLEKCNNNNDNNNNNDMSICSAKQDRLNELKLQVEHRKLQDSNTSAAS